MNKISETLERISNELELELSSDTLPSTEKKELSKIKNYLDEAIKLLNQGKKLQATEKVDQGISKLIKFLARGASIASAIEKVIDLLFKLFK